MLSLLTCLLYLRNFIGFCGNTVTNNGATGTVVDSSNCNYKCAGNSAETCGGSWYLNLYKQ
ncbi:hypothetical protein EV361DRAFT_922716 [Lentinula raphanica]|nr:hypothetical protein FB446DRAFT_728516 [Lentinula raphanica]KAJ3969098.1 hypothetical protein EV361DRAFT_922716 [Lentinula raphanica]